MKNKSYINKKINDALSSVENIQQAQPSPYFYTRLIGKLSKNEMTIWEKFTALLLQPAIAFVTICFIILINAFVLIYSNSNSNIAATSQTEITSADEYSDLATSFYDLENIKP